MNGQLERRVTVLESRSGIIGQRFVMLFGDEAAPPDCDESSILHVPWISVDVARARGWR